MFARKNSIIDYKEKYNDLNLECCSCDVISNDLLETNCGHIYCNHCFRNLNKQLPCLKCNENIITTYCPQSTIRLINKMIIICEQCNEPYVFIDQLHHQKICISNTILCPCGEIIQQKLYDNHVKICVLKGKPLREHNDQFIIDQLKQNDKKICMLENKIISMQHNVVKYVLEDYKYDDDDYEFYQKYNVQLAHQSEKERYDKLSKMFHIIKSEYGHPDIKCKLHPLILIHDQTNCLYHLCGHIELKYTGCNDLIYGSYIIPNYVGTNIPILLSSFGMFVVILEKSSIVVKHVYRDCKQGGYHNSHLTISQRGGNHNSQLTITPQGYLYIDVWFNT